MIKQCDRNVFPRLTNRYTAVFFNFKTKIKVFQNLKKLKNEE